MPHPAQFTHEQLIYTARDLFEQNGYEGVTMAQVAGALGVKASSLYKHVSDKTALLREVNTLTITELTRSLHNAILSAEAPFEQCLAVGRAYWGYALAHPGAYDLAFIRQYNATPDASVLENLALPLQDVFIRAIGNDVSLAALRGAWAFLHGFVSLALGDHFRRDGALDYEGAWRAYLIGWGLTPTPASHP